jgi:hypothetical protein
MEYLKEIFGASATIIALVSYIPYLRDVLANKTKPHMFTWLIWGTLTLIGFLGQILGKAGPGAWPSAVTTALCFSIFFFALVKGNKNLAKIDYMMLAGAGFYGFLSSSPHFPSY